MANDNASIFTVGAANLVKSSRALKRGGTRERYKVTISGDTLLVNTDAKSLGRGPADAIAEVLRDRLGGVAAVASPGTLAYRERAAKSFAAGKRWAVQRYSGGRIGAMPPNQSTRVLNDSGRLAKSIAVGASQGGYTINVAANRLDPKTVRGGDAGVLRIFALMRTHVPELANARSLLDSIPVRRAIEQSVKDSIAKTRASTEAAVAAGVEATRQLMMVRIELAKRLFAA